MLNNRWSYALLVGALVLAFVALTGCSDNEVATARAFAGSYVGTINTDDDDDSPNFTANVDENGITTVIIYAESDAMSATGTVDSTGALHVSFPITSRTVIARKTRVSNSTINFDGQADGNTFTGTWSFEDEDESGTWEAIRVAPGNPWAGSYTGSVVGNLNATFTAAIDGDGTATVNVNSADYGDFTATGTVNTYGTISFEGTVAIEGVGDVPVTYEGLGHVVNGEIVFTGEWSADTYEMGGDWTTGMPPV